MVTVTRKSGLIRICAVNYFSGETLLDSLVYGQVKMLHLNNWAHSPAPKHTVKQKQGHDSLEDARATRELARWYIKHSRAPANEDSTQPNWDLAHWNTQSLPASIKTMAEMQDYEKGNYGDIIVDR